MAKAAAAKTTTIDFDVIRSWHSNLRSALSESVSDSVISAIMGSRPEFLTDARDLLFALANRDAVIDACLRWVASSAVAAYHGTRLTDAEIESVKKKGLIPLVAAERRVRLERALSSHKDWPVASTRLSQVLADLGSGNQAGHREGQVHCTLSRAGLVHGFNHYLTHGAEFDQHAANELVGEDGKQLLAKDGKRTLIQLRLPGGDALKACHPYFSPEALRSRGDVPNLIDDLLSAWSYRLAHPRFAPKAQRLDCGFVFKTAIPATWITDIEILSD
ncbi:hypothetical protein ACVOMS_04975 [Bradyrhizobium guangxiense]